MSYTTNETPEELSSLDKHEVTMRSVTKAKGCIYPQEAESLFSLIDDLRARLAVADAALAAAQGLVDFLNKPLPVNSRAALVERCYQVQLICETIPAHENQTKTAIALSELVTAIRESGGRDETLADLAKARDGLQRLTGAIKRSDELYQQYEFMRNQLAALTAKNAALREALEMAINTVECDSLGIDTKGNKFELPWYRAARAALHPATKEGKAE